MAKKKMKSVEDMLDEIRQVIVSYGHLPEKLVYEKLCEEAEGWQMRLEELEDEDEDEDEDPDDDEEE